MIKAFFALLLGVSAGNSLEIQLLQIKVNLLKKRLSYLETAIPEDWSQSNLETLTS
jgi:hypothetical protein